MDTTLLDGINYPAVIVSAVIYFIIGFLWYSVLFGETWKKETGMSAKPQAKPAPGALIGQFMSTLLFTLGIAVALKLYWIHTSNFMDDLLQETYGVTEGIVVSALVTVFFVIPINSGNLFFTGKKNLFLLDVCERALGSLVVGVILGAWGTR